MRVKFKLQKIMPGLKSLNIPLKNSTRLVTNADNLGGAVISSQFITDLAGNTSVHSAAQTTVGGNCY